MPAVSRSISRDAAVPRRGRPASERDRPRWDPSEHGVGRRASAWLLSSGPEVAGRPPGLAGGRERPCPQRPGPALAAQIRHMLRLDEDLSPFYLVAAADPALAWAVSGAGRHDAQSDGIRGPGQDDLHDELHVVGDRADGQRARRGAGEHRRRRYLSAGRFPSPATMAEAGDAFFRDVARAGYRGPYLRVLADDVASGRLDLEALRDPALPDEEVADRLLRIAGVGPYAMAHMMMLLGRYRGSSSTPGHGRSTAGSAAGPGSPTRGWRGRSGATGSSPAWRSG